MGDLPLDSVDIDCKVDMNITSPSLPNSPPKFRWFLCEISPQQYVLLERTSSFNWLLWGCFPFALVHVSNRVPLCNFLVFL